MEIKCITTEKHQEVVNLWFILRCLFSKIPEEPYTEQNKIHIPPLHQLELDMLFENS